MVFSHLPFKRLLLKISGEMLQGNQPFGIDPQACRSLAASLNVFKESGLQTAIVVGGGNIFRGINLKESGIPRTPADHIGMLATLMNGVALQQALEREGCPAKVMSALECPRVAEGYNWAKAKEYIESGHMLIFVGGTGNPYFTTDTAAALRASEIHADLFLKATKVDGIYDKDPLKYPEARKYDTLTYSQFLAQKLEVMDATSVALCRSNKIPIFVFNMLLLNQGKIIETLVNKDQGTMVNGD